DATGHNSFLLGVEQRGVGDVRVGGNELLQQRAQFRRVDVIGGEVAAAGDLDGRREVRQHGIELRLALHDVALQRADDGALQQLLVRLQLVAVDLHDLGAVEPEGHHGDDDEHAENQIKDGYALRHSAPAEFTADCIVELRLDSGKTGFRRLPRYRMSTGLAAEHGFACRRPGHQLADGVAGRLAVVQDLAHLRGDGHLHAVLARQVHGGVGGEHAFGDHAVHAGDDVVQPASAPELHADGAIAREAAGAGEHQVAHAGQAEHGFAAPSAGHHQPGYFGEATRDQRGNGVVSQAKTIANTGGDGDDVLERAAQLDAGHVVIRVDAKSRIAQFTLHRGGKLRVG